MNRPKTIDEEHFEKTRIDAANNKNNAQMSFNNMALTVDGVLCIGMTHDKGNRHYSCTYTESGGVRNFAGSHRWDLQGNSLDNEVGQLDLGTIQQGIRVI